MKGAEFPSADLESRRQMHMSDSWPPSTNPEDAENVETARVENETLGADGATAPGAGDSPDTAQSAIPLGPPSLPAPPEYWREYPYAGGPEGGASPHPDGLYRPQPLYPTGYPTYENPVPGAESSTFPPPPPGSWPSAPYPGGWSSGPGGAVPPYPGWSVPGYPPPPPATRTKKRGGLAIAAASVLGVVAVLAGAGLGHYIWPSSTPSATSQNSGGSTYQIPGSSSPYGGSSGNGSAGNGYDPFGGSSNSGGSSTGAGAPSDISAIAAKVDPGLVDINTNLSYEDEQAAGTGMVLTSDGEILTNNHVIDGATSISVDRRRQRQDLQGDGRRLRPDR